MWTKEDGQRVITETFGGDTAAYLADMRESHRKAIKWDNLVASAFILPELETDARELIKQLMGYLPQALLTLSEEPFIRSLLHNYRSGGMTVDDLFGQAEEHIKPIRNTDLRFHSEPTYSRKLYEQYFKTAPELAYKIKERLNNLLGYVPALEHSVAAELKLQECYQRDMVHVSDALSRADIQAVTIIKYRETLLSKGKAAADASPLVAMDLIAGQRLKEAKQQ